MPSFLARIAAIGLGGEPDLDVDARRQVVETLQRVDRLRRRLVDVDQALVRADLEVLARVLVLERRADNAVDVLLGRQRHRSRHARAGARRRLNDLASGRLDGGGVIRLEADADLVLVCRCHEMSPCWSRRVVIVWMLMLLVLGWAPCGASLAVWLPRRWPLPDAREGRVLLGNPPHRRHTLEVGLN